MDSAIIPTLLSILPTMSFQSLRRTTQKLLVSDSNGLGIMELNNPRAFHALDLEMIFAMQDTLKDWLFDSHIHAFVLKSGAAKRPIFCSGGDVKSVALDCKNNVYQSHGLGSKGMVSADFFREEYYVNHALAQQRKTQISLWDGLVFGGGVGISIFGKYRIATENSLLAMPETAIGFFPDVGALYQLQRILNGTHMTGVLPYLALTGHRFDAPDLLYSGIATHFCPSEHVNDMVEAMELVLGNPHEPPEAAIETVIHSFDQLPKQVSPPEESFLAQNLETLNQVFHESASLESILQELKGLNSEFGNTTLTKLQEVSPASLKITLELLKRGKDIKDVGQHLALEYRLSQHLMKMGSDFHEGIRAALLDKKKKNAPPAQWNPLDQISDAFVRDYYFEQPIPEEWNAKDSPILTSFAETSNL